jgi:hypothetical protein
VFPNTTGQTSLALVTVGTATNIASGTANYVVYQSASSTTGFISPTSNVGYALISNGLGSAPSLQAIVATNISGGTVQSPSTITYSSSTLTLPKIISNDTTDASNPTSIT